MIAGTTNMKQHHASMTTAMALSMHDAQLRYGLPKTSWQHELSIKGVPDRQSCTISSAGAADKGKAGMLAEAET